MSGNLMAAASASPQVLVNTLVSGTSESTVYTSSASPARTVKIGKASITNKDSAPCKVGVSVCKVGQTASTSTQTISENAPGLDQYDMVDLDWLAGEFLGPGDFISIKPERTNCIVFKMSGVVFE